MSNRRISDKGLNLIKQHESLQLDPYRDPSGFPTVGYGHLLIRDADADLGQFESVTEEQALELLRQDTGDAERTVNQMVDVPLTQEQFDALVSLVFNIGPGNFQTSSLRRHLNNGDYEAAQREFPKWRKSENRILPGLVRRRAEEAELFASGGLPQTRGPFTFTGQETNDLIQAQEDAAPIPVGEERGLQSRRPADPNQSHLLPLNRSRRDG